MAILGHIDEGRDALIEAALGRLPSALDAWRRWDVSVTDSLSDPVALRWLPLAGWNLRDAGIDACAHDAFMRVRHGIWASNVRLIAATAPAIDALEAAGLRLILLKGAALVATVYEAPGLRPIGDVDVLVESDQAGKAHSVLSALGWRPIRRVNREDLPLCHALNFQKPPRGALDLHWHLLPENVWAGIDDGLWRRARPLTPFRPAVLVLGHADQLLHVCLHGLRWSPVHAGHWLADAVRIIERAGSDLDWDVLVDEAHRRGLRLQISEALRLLQRVAGAPVPSRVLGTLDAERISWRDRLECAVKTRPVTELGGVFLIWCEWARLARVQGSQRPDWLRYLAAAVGVGSRSGLRPWALRHGKAWLRRFVAGTPRRGASKRQRRGQSSRIW